MEVDYDRMLIGNMKISFVTIALNEERRIGAFLESLRNQSKRPDEIIFVDNGSKDRTVQKIEASGLKARILVKSGIPIAVARNFGIKRAKNDIIVMADSDCVLHKDWLEKITVPFQDDSIDIVAGFYEKAADSVLQKSFLPYYGVSPKNIDLKNFMPATCSIAFRREIWEKVGGFDEKLERAGEDTLFNYRAKQLGAKFVTAPEAIVDWEVPKTWKEAAKKFYYYAKGDAQTGIWWHPSKRFSTHNLKIIAIYARYLVSLVFFILGFRFPFLWALLGILFLSYLVWAIWKNYNQVRVWQAIFLLPAIQIVSDFCVMAGFASGIFKRI